MITNPSSGLTEEFESTGTSSTYWDGSINQPKERLIYLKFTCQIAESFNHEYTLVFYKDGVKVAEEIVKVEVVVE